MAKYLDGDGLLQFGQGFLDKTLSVSGKAADAKSVGDEITDVKEDLNTINPISEMSDWVDGKYIGTSGTTANPSSPTNDSSYRYLYVTATDGEVFTINATGGNTPRTWAFIDSSNNVLDKATANLTCNNLLITAPENSAYLIINDKKTNKSCYRGKGIRRDISDLYVKADVCDAVASAKGLINLSDVTWELGNISNLTGQKVNSTSRICTPDYIDITGLSTISYSIDSTAFGVIFAYYSDKTEDSWIESDSAWLMGLGTTKAKGNYVRLSLSTNTLANSSKLTAFAYNPIVEALASKNTANKHPLHGIAHQGNAGNAYNDPPAQTGINYINAFNKGYKFVEGDIRFTSDEIAILNHDNDISQSYTWYYANTDTRVTTSVLISANTYADLYDDYDIRRSAGNYITKVLTFEQWIIICRDLNIYPYIELKTDANYTDAQIAKLVSITKLYAMENNCAWFAESADLLRKVLVNNPSARIGYAPINDSDTTKIATAASLKTPSNEVWVQYRYTNVTASIIAEAKEAGVPLIVWTVDTEADMLALDEYISGVLSNTLDYSVVRKNALIAQLS